jgi:glycosyltransferase involved in cell wall biosynthesis
MTIVSVGPAPPWRGGIANYHYAAVEALRNRGAEVDVLSFRKLYPKLLFPGTSASDTGRGALPPLGEQILQPLSPASWRRAARWVDERDPATVLFHWWHPFFAPAYLGLLRHLSTTPRVGFLCHNVSSHERMPGGAYLTRRLLRKGTYFVVGGHSLADEVERIRPGAEVAIVLHPSYRLPHTERTRDRAEARERLGLPAEGTVFLFFGLVREYKGLDTLLEALALLPPEAEWTCLVAGEFYQPRAPYERMIESLGLAGRVRLEDRYIANEEVPDYFAATDVTVLPYRNATQSGVAALSIALERPVLSTRVGALPEMISEGENGWLVPPEDPAALAERLGEIVADPDRARPGVGDGRGGLPSWDELAETVLRLAAANNRGES